MTDDAPRDKPSWDVPESPAARTREEHGASGWRRFGKYVTVWNIITVAILIWAAPRLLPHVGALVGIGSGPDVVPTYSYASLDGKAMSSDSLRGKVVLVNFWATWCTPCKVEMPLLEMMHKRHEEAGFLVVGLAVDRVSTEVVRAFVVERGVSYPIAHVGPEAEQVFGGVRGYPTSFLLDRTGRIRHTVIGPVAPLSLEPAVRRLLAE